ncbi:hypothetical protein BDW59DRAFT_174596 [Aspergillus cavernicola]|uniref:Ketoreductase domain-containing protein n=1 Tax=Aspergillus cavernicola TaxID=176166 RepID=A0ABR4HZF2_9EURO
MTSYLITGSSRGIGLELTRQLVNSNKDVTIFASSRSSNSAEFRNLLEKHPEQIMFVTLDVTRKESIEKAVERVSAKLDGRELDVLINNAGALSLGRVEDMQSKDLEEIFRTNVSGVHEVTKAMLPLMRRGGKKKILNISSMLGSITNQSQGDQVAIPSYSISKAALNMLTVAYAHDLEKEGFTVFCVSPGWLKSDMGGQNADLPVKTGVTGVLEILERTGRDGNGRFFNIHVPGWERYTGEEIPW